MEEKHQKTRLLDKDAFKSLLIALLILVAGEVVLAWQYHRIEGKRLPQIEQKLEQQRQEFERQTAENILKEFLNARIAKDETKAARYLTEQAMAQKETGVFKLIDNFTDYEITETSTVEPNGFRFQLTLFGEGGKLQQIELVTVQKILDQYYIDSIELAG
ncbi:MAG: hypothetical protein AAB567_01665 [Patescibacteria group bacterium]